VGGGWGAEDAFGEVDFSWLSRLSVDSKRRERIDGRNDQNSPGGGGNGGVFLMQRGSTIHRGSVLKARRMGGAGTALNLTNTTGKGILKRRFRGYLNAYRPCYRGSRKPLNQPGKRTIFGKMARTKRSRRRDPYHG